jgi:hypothetical protein
MASEQPKPLKNHRPNISKRQLLNFSEMYDMRAVAACDHLFFDARVARVLRVTDIAMGDP